VAAPAPAACRNCAAPLDGAYCARCGQRDTPADPTLRELGGDLVEQLLNLDGRVVSTFRALLRHPGRLTLDFLAGRRAPFLSPLRMYLTCSVLFFGIAAITPPPLRTIAATSGTEPVTQLELPGITVGAADEARQRVDEMRRSPSRVTRFIGAQAAKALASDPRRLKQRADDAWPKLMFLLVPMFAALTAGLFRGRFRYPAHLVFAMHVHAFAFLALTLIQLGEAADTMTTVLASTAVAWTAVLVYLVLAVRRVFAASLVGAVVGTTALSLAYVIVLSVVQLLFVAIIIARP
jgi:hypothetical protein